MKLVISAILLFCTQAALAHPGHDHSHWTSYLAHAGLALPVLAILYFGLGYVKRKKTEKE